MMLSLQIKVLLSLWGMRLLKKLHHNESDLLEIRARGKKWPGMKLRRIEEINDFLSVIKKAHELRYDWRPYNDEQYTEEINSEL